MNVTSLPSTPRLPWMTAPLRTWVAQWSVVASPRASSGIKPNTRSSCELAWCGDKHSVSWSQQELWAACEQTPRHRSQHSPVGVCVGVGGEQQGSHASSGQCPPTMARLNQQVHVAAQKTLLHVDVFASVRQQEVVTVTWKSNHGFWWRSEIKQITYFVLNQEVDEADLQIKIVFPLVQYDFYYE